MIFIILTLAIFLISHRIRFYTYLFIKNADLLRTGNLNAKINSNFHIDIYSSNKLETDFIFYRKKHEASFIVKNTLLKNSSFQEHIFHKSIGVKSLKYHTYSIYNHLLDLVFLLNYLALKFVLGKEKLSFLFILFSELRLSIKGHYKGQKFLIGIV